MAQGTVIRFNPRALEASIHNISTEASKNASRAMKRAAIRIRDLAISYAPVKTGLLEKNILMDTVKDGRRNAYVVYINVDAMRYIKAGQLGDYAWIMEENLRPYGRAASGGKRYYISAKSAAKGPRVGGKFLKRAVDEGSKDVIGDTLAAVKRVLGGRVVPMQTDRPDYWGGGEE